MSELRGSPCTKEPYFCDIFISRNDKNIILKELIIPHVRYGRSNDTILEYLDTFGVKKGGSTVLCFFGHSDTLAFFQYDAMDGYVIDT